MYSHSTIKTLPAEEKARIKETENITRFETHCIFKGVQPTYDMRTRVSEACRRFYDANPDEITVPTDVLIESGLGTIPGVELNI